MALLFGGSGIGSGRTPITIELTSGATYIIGSGTWAIDLDNYTTYEVLDQQTGTWRVAGAPGARNLWIDSDGNNHRLANTTGCVVGATVTSGGAGYTSAPVVAVNSGGAAFTAILGPVVNTIAVVNGGSGYTYPPLVIINTPPNAGGVAATAFAAIAAGIVTAVTVTDQGAGFIGVPSVTLVNDPRDATGAGALAVATLTGQGTVAALLCTNHGTASGISTSGVLPTITLAGGGFSTVAAAVPVMDWSVTSYTVTSAGAGYVSAGATAFATASGSPTYTNPTIQANVVRQQAPMFGVLVSGGALTVGTAIGQNGGHLPNAGTAVVLSGGTTPGSIGLVYGGQNSTAILLPV